VRAFAVSRQPTPKGLYLRETSLIDGTRRELLALDMHLATIDWGQTMLIDYRGAEAQALKAAVILPPGYQPGRRYPTIVWVYASYQVYNLDDYWLDPYLPGIYNLQLYAARGYVVLIPSIPLKRDAPRNDLYADIPKGVLPAIDRLVELGLTDSARVGIMGQSFGGYGVYALVTQTNHFKAAVAIAGFVDLTSHYTQFTATARGYPGIEHEKSDNWSEIETGPITIGVPPYDDHPRFWRNSPLAYVDRVNTPLLLIHGEYDIRGPIGQAESFFYSLYRQGKTARLLRYWGEDHGLAQSPANVRDIFGESVRWFDKYLGATAGRTTSPRTAPAS
jgi:dipeptidyl aminopeptidase/acylaminoacyl peptidase